MSRRRALSHSLQLERSDLFYGLVIVGLMALHLAAVLRRAVSGQGFGGEARFAYDFQFYSLLLLGVVIIMPGLVFVIHVHRLTESEAEAWKPYDSQPLR